MRKTLLGLALACTTAAPAMVLGASLTDKVMEGAKSVHQKAIEWRHDIHEHPELGNQEHRTAELIADHLRSLGMEVQTDVGTTGVVAVLKGGKPGPVVGLRADMDALPVKEQTGLPYASEVKQDYQGKDSWVMHACGHDAHVAILMAVAENLASVKDELPGTVKFIFQPAEEGPSDYVYKGEQHFGGRLLVDEGVLKNPDVDAIFGLHVTSKPPPASSVIAVAPPWPAALTCTLPSTASRPTVPHPGMASIRWLPAPRSSTACKPLSAARPTSCRHQQWSPSAPLKAGRATTSSPTRWR